jgi:hypothetical protein
MFLIVVAGLVFSAGEPGARGAEASGQDRSAVDLFETSVRPVLAGSCLRCHGPEKQSSGLRLDSREALMSGGSSGPAIVPGDPGQSLLVQAVAQTHEELKMPPKKKLPDPAIAAIRRWVEMGAPWGSPAPTGAAGAGPGRGHWAFTPIRHASVPAVRKGDWTRNFVDAFVLERLEQAGLVPSSSADRRTLIRRATVDLLGIPPTAEEIEAFETDPSPDAYPRLVERLLASPLYGERWGRHWLDVARYADTKGYVFQEERKYPFAYTYRDYVIRSFNRDLPFDRFVIEQVAADQLDLEGDPTPLAAMGFLTVGRRFLNDQNEIIDDRIDVVGRGLLGLSLGCARCHDHKYDPIPSEDYYSLYGVFASSVEPDELPRLERAGVPDPPETDSLRHELEAARKARDAYLAARTAELEKDLHERFSKYLKAAFELDLNPRHPKLDERAAADKLVPQRIRAVSFLWRRRLESAEAPRDPVVGTWKALAAVAKEGFAAKAREILSERSIQPGSVHPLLAKTFRDRPPASMDQVAARYVEILSGLEARSRALDPKTKQPRRALAEPDWESLRLAVFGPGGIVSIPADGARFVLDRPQRQRYTALSNAVQKLEAKSAGKAGRAMVMRDAPQPMEPHVLIRGNPGRPGKAVPRRFLKVLSGPDRRPFQKGSGRLELAQAVADAKNPLTARVLVNRVWHWHFGQGLVTTPSDFGVRSDPPSHPGLLDELAATFIDDGWSIKSLHRRIMLSSTYQQRSDPREDGLMRDPQNRLVWRFNRQRLDFETLRDSVLAVSGSLELAQAGPSVPINEPPFPPRRTVYGFIDRQNLDGVYRTFDFSVPDATSPKRFITNVPQQALFLMNSPFVQDQARELALAVERDTDHDSASTQAEHRVRLVYRKVLGRSPGPRELELGTAFLDRKPAEHETVAPLAQLAQVLMLTNEFMFVD